MRERRQADALRRGGEGCGTCGISWCGVVWCGGVRGVVCCVVVWWYLGCCIVVWYGVVWCGVIWCSSTALGQPIET